MPLFNIFKIIVLSSFIGSIMMLIILLVKCIFRSKLSCTFHYYIWLILLIKLLIPFGPKTSLNISNIYEKFYINNIMNERSHINSSKQFQNITFHEKTPINTYVHSNKNIINPTTHTALKNKINIKYKLNIGKCFYIIWIFVTILLIAILVTGYKKLKNIIKTSTKDISISHKKILYNCINTMNIHSHVELLYSYTISTPCLCGLITPKILIPINVSLNLSHKEFKYILMHELTHLKRKDIFINWIITLLSIIYWFNPLLLYSFHKIKQDCEISCDSKVISYLKKGENLKYGNTLIKVLELRNKNNNLIGTTSLIVNGSQIKRRITMISKYKKINIKGILLGSLLVFFIGILGIILNTSISNKNITKAVTLHDSPVSTSKNKVNTTSNKTSNSIAPISPSIVIYNSHANEEYQSHLKVTDVASLLKTKLIKKGLKSNFLMCTPPTKYIKSYDNTRNLIIKNIPNYSNTILLDIHRDIIKNSKSNTKKIILVLSRDNPHYKENKKFANLLLTEFKKSTKIKSDILEFNSKSLSYFNQDLSNNAILIEIGNNMSNHSDIDECLNAIVSALKNIDTI